MPLGTEPSCMRQEVCMYWVICLFRSRAQARAAAKNRQETQLTSTAAIAARCQFERTRGDWEEAIFFMFVAEHRQTLWTSSDVLKVLYQKKRTAKCDAHHLTFCGIVTRNSKHD